MSVATLVAVGTLVTMLGGSGWWFRGELGMKASHDEVAAALAPIAAQVADIYDARIEGVIRQIADLEKKLAEGTATDIDKDRLQQLRKEYERLKKLQKQ